MENQGWIKLHRKILDNPICKKPNYAWLWVYLLLKANHKEEKFMWNKEIIIIKDGQLLTGRKQLSQETGIPEGTIEGILTAMDKNGHQIQQQKTTKFRIITILNWKEYQQSDRKTDNKRTTNGQQTDTNKNDNNEKNEKNISTGVAGGKINEIIELFKVVNPSYQVLFRRPPQRAAAERMFKKFGEEELRRMIGVLSQINKIPYMPISTTPCQMEENLGKIKERLNQEKNKKAEKQVPIIG